MGNVAETVDLSGYITGAILIIAYTATLVHVCQGSKYKLVTHIQVRNSFTNNQT